MKKKIALAIFKCHTYLQTFIYHYLYKLQICGNFLVKYVAAAPTRRKVICQLYQVIKKE